ncbi:MAG: sigma-70 family RNA polymerase sigma factor [Bdellovibrionota bacterium]
MQGVESLSDEALMEAYQQGNGDAFAVLYRRHSAKVYGFLLNRLKDSTLVEDVFQAAFMKLHKSRLHYDPSFPFVPWLFTVCKSVMVDNIRKRRGIQEEIDPIAVEQAVADEPEEQPSLPSLTSLPEAQRKALELRYGQDLSFEEISKRLETSQANVRQLVSRAIKRLRAKP